MPFVSRLPTDVETLGLCVAAPASALAAENDDRAFLERENLIKQHMQNDSFCVSEHSCCDTQIILTNNPTSFVELAEEGGAEISSAQVLLAVALLDDPLAAVRPLLSERNWERCQKVINVSLEKLGDFKTKISVPLPDHNEDLHSELIRCKELEGSVEGWKDDLSSLFLMRDILEDMVRANDITVLQERLQLLRCQWDEVCQQVSLHKQQVCERFNEWAVFNEKNKELTEMESKVSQNGNSSFDEMIEKLRKLGEDELDGSDREVDVVEDGEDLAELQWDSSSFPRMSSHSASGTANLICSGCATLSSIDSIPLEWDHCYNLNRALESPINRGQMESSRVQDDEGSAVLSGERGQLEANLRRMDQALDAEWFLPDYLPLPFGKSELCQSGGPMSEVTGQRSKSLPRGKSNHTNPGHPESVPHHSQSRSLDAAGSISSPSDFPNNVASSTSSSSTKGPSFLRRVLVAALPFLLLLLILTVLVSIVPSTKEGYSCHNVNSFARSFHLMLRYTNGPPPI